MAGMQLDFRSYNEVIGQLSLLPKEFSPARKRTILRQGFKPFLKEAERMAPKKTGALKKAIKTKTFRNNKSSVFAGVIENSRKKLRDAAQKSVFYAYFIEFGFQHIAWPKEGETLKKGISPFRVKTVSPKPFIRPAWDATIDKVFQEDLKIINKRLIALYKKNNRK